MSVIHRDPGEQVQILDEAGQVRADATVPDLSDAELLEMYRGLKLGRHFDTRAVSLQRQGRMGTYPPMAGQEAAQVGSALALAASDWVFPSYREHVVSYLRGWPLADILLYWMGSDRGAAPPEGVNVFTTSVPIATQIPHATGAAWASTLRQNGEETPAKAPGEDSPAFLCYFGDGATSEGDFHEGLNFAGVFDVPAVFFCNNNQWAISVPRERQTASATLAQKAHAYGFEGVQVDGMDPLAVYAVTRDALATARGESEDAGHADEDRAEASEKADAVGTATRPTMIEAVQYRFGAHTTADDPSVYREEAEVERWKQKDPIPRMEAFLRDRGLLDDERVREIETEVADEVAAAIEEAENRNRPEPAELFEDVYAEATARLNAQERYLAELRTRHGDEVLLE